MTASLQFKKKKKIATASHDPFNLDPPFAPKMLITIVAYQAWPVGPVFAHGCLLV